MLVAIYIANIKQIQIKYNNNENLSNYYPLLNYRVNQPASKSIDILATDQLWSRTYSCKEKQQSDQFSQLN